MAQQHRVQNFNPNQLERLRQLEVSFPKSRILLACGGCYMLKPSIVVELGANECSWCSRRDKHILLCETTSDNRVEYSVIRDCKSMHHHKNAECEDNLGLRWRSCVRGDDCTFAHSKMELKVWDLQSHQRISTTEIVMFFKQKQPISRDTLRGVFHCFICGENVESGEEFSKHCDESSHKHLMTATSRDMAWKYREPPDDKNGKFQVCLSVERDVRCKYSDRCYYAHSVEELNEWNKRCKLQKEKRKYAEESGLVSFADKIFQEYQDSSSPAVILKPSLQGVEVKVSSKKQQTMARHKKQIVWEVKIQCTDSSRKLNHAAFIMQSARDKGFFTICRKRHKNDRSAFTEHMDFTVTMNSDSSRNLHNGSGKFEVKFKAHEYGKFSGHLVFEFRDTPRPALHVQFCVNVVADDASADLYSQQHKLDNQEVSWERDREIIRCEQTDDNPFNMVLSDLAKKYKQPDVALEYSAERMMNDDSKQFNPNQLTENNYAEEMHKFLYREEAARTQKLAGPRKFDIAMTENYMSANQGLCYIVPDSGELYAIFKVPNYLSRDTDEGLLILEYCNKVLICRSNDLPDSPVYEVMIREMFVDHVILHFQKRCVEDWHLGTGDYFEAELRFQLDRDRFCRCHFAIDQLVEQKQLSLVCPNPRANYHPRHQPQQMLHQQLDAMNLNLDDYQRNVWNFMKQPVQITAAGNFPLYAVFGPFGTGKTYTICKCILHLLQTNADARILICTHSNSAADLYIENNFQNVNQWKDKVVRVLYHGRNLKTVKPLVQKYCLHGKNGFRYPTAKEITSHKVVITTFTTALALGIKGTGLNGAFTHIFLDEAAQIMEAEVIIPLTLVDSKKTKIVIAGDHKQISERIHSRDLNQIQKQHQIKTASDSDFTLLVRIYNHYNDQKDTRQFYQQDNSVFLRNNYRCVEPILRLIEDLFYRQDMLHSRTEVPLIPGLIPIHFFDVQGECIQDPFTSGYYNDSEACQVTDIVERILKKYKIKPTDIVVVSSYSEQVRLMRQHMRRRLLQDVKVHRVRNIQGLEFKVVILSCVHHRESKFDTDGQNYGLLSDSNLLNTAFTRSMLAVIAVGNAVTLWSLGKCKKLWRKYLETCASISSLYPKNVTLTSIKQDLASVSSLNPLALGFTPGALIEPQKSSENLSTPEEEPHSSSSVDDLDDDSDDEDDLPLEDKLLDDIVKREMGINAEKLIIRVDKSGREYADDPNEVDEKDLEQKRRLIHSSCTLPQLEQMLHESPGEYKRCRLELTSWYTADAVVLDHDSAIEKILIKNKRSLGRTFDNDEVVVHIIKKIQQKNMKTDEKETVYFGKVVGILERYKEPRSRKFVCVPDRFSPGVMCPLDRKTTNFVIIRPRDFKTSLEKIPIYKPALDKKRDIKLDRVISNDIHKTTLGGGMLFIVQYMRWSQCSNYPLGYVSDVIVPKNIDQYYSIVHDLPPAHRKPINKEANSLSKNYKPDRHRKNLSELFVFTIDPEGSTDLDDALSIEKCNQHEKCWKIGIHIADVASVIPAHCEVDKEARKRATTFYGGDIEKRKIAHMLPEELSSKTCSLLADGKPRPAISTFIHSTKLPFIGSPKNKNVQELNLPIPELTIIQSKRKMTYKEAEDFLRQVRLRKVREFTKSSEDNLPDQLALIWQSMVKLRFQRLDFALFQNQPGFKGFHRFCNETTAHMLIEEAMITVNACSTLFLDRKKCEFILRTQNGPLPSEWQLWNKTNEKLIEKSLSQQSRVRYLVGTSTRNDQQEDIDANALKSQELPMHIFGNVWTEISNALERNDLESALMLFCSDTLQPGVCAADKRFMKIQSRAALQTRTDVRKQYNQSSITHFSLRLPMYTWCSSPIRRYTDIISQRLIVAKCKAMRNVADPNVIVLDEVDRNDLKKLAREITHRHGDAKGYEKDTRNSSFAKQLINKQQYEIATITEVDEEGMSLSFMELKDLPRLACVLKYGELKFHKQDSSTFIWRIRYYDVQEQGTNSGLKFVRSHNSLLSSTLAAREWRMLMECIETAMMGPDNLNGLAKRNEIKNNFKILIDSQKETALCRKKCSTAVGPCNNDECRNSNCSDVLAYQSKLRVPPHYRRIKITIEPGKPVSVQLYATRKYGLFEPTLQLLTLTPDYDICLLHQRSPVEIFAADVRPRRTNKFQTLTAYKKHWIPLFRMDGVYNAVKDGNSSITFQNVTVQWKADEGSFMLNSTYCGERLIDIDINDFLCLRFKNLPTSTDSEHDQKMNERYTWVTHALVHQPPKDADLEGYFEVGFQICKSLVDENLKVPNAVKKDGVVATVELIQLGISHRTMTDALEIVDEEESNKEVLAMLCLDSPSLYRPLTPDESIEGIIQSVGNPLECPRGFKYPLNPGQAHEVQKALGRQLSLIQGPPGTGKSFLGAHLAYYAHRINMLKPGPLGQILYAGPSNKAVDVVAEYLKDSSLKVVRVYGSTHEEKDYPNPLKPNLPRDKNEKLPDKKLASISLHHLIRRNGTDNASKIVRLEKKFAKEGVRDYSEYKYYKRLIIKEKIRELQKHDVIICTCATASILMKLIRNDTNSKQMPKKKEKEMRRFSQCIIDECGMCSEPETLTPIVATGAEQVILIGDHMQLQPIIMCQRAKDFGLGVSMFERLKESAGMLTTQYRMSPGICEFPSSEFYDGRLVAHPSISDRDAKNHFRFCYPPDKRDNNAIFCHVIGTEKVNFGRDRGGENSQSNELEAQVVVRVLKYLHLVQHIPLSNIMILSPYLAQCHTIRSQIEMERSQMWDVHVGTVITSQGSECDYVILSTVRSQPESAIEEDANLHWRRKYIGFVADPHQINVAITRAKLGLCIVGNKLLLAKDTETWSSLLESYEHRGSVVDYDHPMAPWNNK